MQTLSNVISNKHLQRAERLALFVLMALAMVAAAFPQPAMAAATCSAYYTVKSGDTTSMIAHKYGLTWKEIASANDLKSPYKLKVGQTLCIPAQSVTTVVEPGKMTATANGKVLSVTMSGFDKRYIWIVKVKASRTPFAMDYKIGRMTVPKNTTVLGLFQLPQALRKTPYLTVCVKNSTTDVKICQQIPHTL